MYVCVKNLMTDKYEVGFFAPDGRWCVAADSIYKSRYDALCKVHYLNGSEFTDLWRRLMFMLRDWSVRNA